jgi:hypothetical protein
MGWSSKVIFILGLTPGQMRMSEEFLTSRTINLFGFLLPRSTRNKLISEIAAVIHAAGALV